MTDSFYPIPGTNTERILHFIRDNPGVSVSGILKETRLNPSPLRTYLSNLLDKDLIEDRQNSAGHHYYIKGQGSSGAFREAC